MADLSEETAGAGMGMLVLVTISVFGFVTSLAMIGPLLLDLARDLEIPVGQAGLLATVMSLPWALAAPLTGVLSDRLGRRPLIVLALAGVGGSSLGAALAPHFGALLVWRFVAGIFGAFGPASLMAAVGDLFPIHRRGMAMGWVNMGFSVAAIVGVPLIGAVGGTFGWRWAFATLGVLLLLLAALVRAFFPPSRRSGAGGTVFAGYRAALRVPLLGNVLAANLLERMIFNSAALYLPPFLMLSYGLTAASVAPALALVAIGTILGTLLGGWLGDRLPKAALFVVAQVAAGGVGLVVFGQPWGLTLSIALAGAFSLANATSRPAFLALSSELSRSQRGTILGLVSLTNQGGAAFGSGIGALVIGLGTYAGLGAMLLAGGIVASLTAIPLARRR